MERDFREKLKKQKEKQKAKEKNSKKGESFGRDFKYYSKALKANREVAKGNRQVKERSTMGGISNKSRHITGNTS